MPYQPEPKTFYNPTNEVVEFFYDSLPYQVGPKEKEFFNGIIARHITQHVNSPLVEYEKGVEDKSVDQLEYEKMQWGALRKLAAEEGLYQVGMNKKEVVEALTSAKAS